MRKVQYCNSCLKLSCYVDTEKAYIIEDTKSILYYRCDALDKDIPRKTRSRLIKSPDWCPGRITESESEE